MPPPSVSRVCSLSSCDTFFGGEFVDLPLLCRVDVALVTKQFLADFKGASHTASWIAHRKALLGGMNVEQVFLVHDADSLDIFEPLFLTSKCKVASKRIQSVLHPFSLHILHCKTNLVCYFFIAQEKD